MTTYECTRCGARVVAGNTLDCRKGPCPMAIVQTRCCDCGAKLTAEERKYYEYRCERCEGHNFDLFEAPPRRTIGFHLRRALNYLSSLLD